MNFGKCKDSLERVISPQCQNVQGFSRSAQTKKRSTIIELHLIFNHTYLRMFLMSRTYRLKITTFAKRFYGLCHHVTVFVWTEQVTATIFDNIDWDNLVFTCIGCNIPLSDTYFPPSLPPPDSMLARASRHQIFVGPTLNWVNGRRYSFQIK